jgi:hypothetical protein
VQAQLIGHRERYESRGWHTTRSVSDMSDNTVLVPQMSYNSRLSA